MEILVTAGQEYIIIADYIIIIILALAAYAGYVIGKRSKNSPGRSQSQKSGPVKSLPYAVPSGMSRPLTYGILWVIFLMFILPWIESAYPLGDISVIFVVISGIIGIYAAYPVIMWVDRKIPNTDFGVWTRRIIAVALILGGMGLTMLLIMSTALTVATMLSSGTVHVSSITSIAAILVGFSFGIAIFAGYIEYTFERKAGLLVFHGRQRF